MKLSRNIKYGLGTLAVLLVMIFGLLIYSASAPKKVGNQAKDPTICEFCGGKLNKAGECPACSLSMGQEAYLAKRESKNWYNSPAIATAVITLLCILILFFIAVYWGSFFSRDKEEESYYIRCTKCGRKLRYRESQANHLGRCPLCHKPILFPKPPDEAREKSTWRNLVRYVWG